MGFLKVTGQKPAPAAKPVATAVNTAADALQSLKDVPVAGDVFQTGADLLRGKPIASVYGPNVQSSGGLNSATGKIPDSAWSDPAQLVGAMTQNVADPADSNGPDRCGPTNLLAGALLQGPGAAASFLDNVAGNAGSNLSADEQKELGDIANRLRAHTATFDDLSRAQHLLYKAGDTRMNVSDVMKQMVGKQLPQADVDRLDELLNKDAANYTSKDLADFASLVKKAIGKDVDVRVESDPRLGKGKQLFVHMKAGQNNWDHSGLDDGEILSQAKAGGLKAKAAPFDAGGEDAVDATMKKLKPGESAVIRIGSRDGDASPDHFVTIGKLKDGRPFIYNPDPTQGDSTLMIGSAGKKQPFEFLQELAKYSARAMPDADGGNPNATVIHY